ncbi:MAG: acyl-CoA dehydrogenase family protein [Alphaproteobacteria bacterium]|jgi:alkylation response protein AidB-like acyl-CoA dehydrogenase|nr:acyl-CoA dehydrogenase [Rhodospirillaceae bacterium]MDP6023088.1 acyl-CoA dehydrogenase family protein [Alphaproteobacteria bacterium]MDP7054639.1 acyl-CoA dehydrogenase family protein [Alphaproteobacteria bacterium]MDP7228599.1 acyl-CoA dehydrogenase family protein [Alphaproteobacteria bacterium]MDP7462558.1 acyl-CoA dehydrogenase family protein [Alphaproteobacteria bacterium]|tara:strand:- start:1092 stop:2222 length:1131 start_codon:yes stop_codon:yes gene_type:complete
MTEQAEILFSDEQAQLMDIAESFSASKSPIDAVRRRIEAESAIEVELWREMAVLGWLGIAIPEEYGGSGLGLGEVVSIVEPMGRRLFSAPLASTTLVAQTVLLGGDKAQKSHWLPQLAGGTVAALALTEAHGDWDLSNLTCAAERAGGTITLSGGKTFVTDAAMADVLLVSVALDGAPALVLLETSALPSAALRREVVIDETRRSHAVDLNGVEVPSANLLPQDGAADCLKSLHLSACLLYAAEMCGGTAGVINVTLEYLLTRRQFDHFIGAYQALKHPMVDALVGLEQARSHLYHAATIFDPANAAEGEIAVRMAKAQAADAFAFASDRAIQFHGAFGFTYDCDAQLYRRRALWCEQQHGDGAHHRKHLAGLLLD